MKKKRKFPVDVQRIAVEELNANTTRGHLAATARKYGIQPSLLTVWRRKFAATNSQ